ncbi:hypothetical protein QZH41_012136, partial [Actinostola sp. cb2023]
ILKLAQENSALLKETLRSIKTDNISPSCLQEALERASQKGHVNAVQSIILAGVKGSLKFNDCMVMALQFNFIQALSVLLVCYAAQLGHVEMLQYLLDGHQTQEQKDIALKQLPFSKNCHSHIINIRKYLKDKDTFHVAVPLQLSLHNKHKEATKILLMSTNCSKDSRVIEWRKLALRELDPSLLKDIRWVERLQLPYNMLVTIPSNIVDLHKLCRLNLQNNQLQRIPSGLVKMNCLRVLNLSHNKLTELPRKSHWSPSLKTLDVSDNLLETLPKNMATSKLKNLYIARNSLYEVPPCVCELLTLMTLDLSGNSRLTQLPVQMGKLTNISTLKLDNLDQVTDPPDHIKKNGPKTIMYLRAKLRNARGYYSMKLMLVGRAAQGKTTLMHRLMLDYTYNSNSATNGISMDEFRIRKDLFHKEYLFRLWDFGGQEDYYATHQCFLSTLSLYILVWNLEEREEGVAKLEGWLDTISSRAPGTCLIIVGTHLDKIRKDKIHYDDEYVAGMHKLVEDLKAQPKYQRIVVLGIKEVSCAVDSREGIDELRISIYDAAFSMLKVNGTDEVSVMGELIPHSYLLIEELVKNKKEEFKKTNRLPFIHRAEFEAIVTDTIRRDSSDVEDPNDIKDVTTFLHERGILMHYDDPNQDLQDYYFIDPAWLCDLMARIVTLKEANPHIINGILFRDKFEFIFRSERFPYEYYPQFVRLLNRFQIACSLDENRLLVPSKLPEEKPAEATNVSLPFITIKRIHSLPFMPYGLWDRLMARLLYYTEDMLTTGCSSEPRPSSPGGPEIHHLSPFLLDPFSCKCPLVSSGVGVGLSDSDEPREASAGFNENDLKQGANQSNEESTPSEEIDGPSGDNEDVELDDDGDDEFAFAGVTRYVDGEDDDLQGGVRINGQWFRNERSLSDSDFGYSTDEDGESIGYGVRQGPYVPRVVRHRAMSYKGRKKKHKEQVSESFDFSPQSFSHASEQLHTRTSSDAVSSVSSCSSSFNREPIEPRLSKKKADSSQKAPTGSYNGSGSSLASSYTYRKSQSNPTIRENSLFGANVPVGSPDSLSSHSPRSDHDRSTSSSSIEAHQLPKPIRIIRPEPLDPPVDVEQIQRQACELPSQSSIFKKTLESDVDSAFLTDQLSMNGSSGEGNSKESSVSSRLLPTIEQYLHINNHEDSSNDISQHKENKNKSVKDTSMPHHNKGILQSLAEHSHTLGSTWPNQMQTNDIVSRSQGSPGAFYRIDQSGSNNTTDVTVSRNDSEEKGVSEEHLKDDTPQLVPNGTSSPNQESSEDNLRKNVPDIEQNGTSDPNQEGSSESNATTNGPDPLQNGTSSSNRHSGVKRIIQEPVHERSCLARKDFPLNEIPDIATDLSTLVDSGSLRCWRRGVCLQHERLFFTISTMDDPTEEDRVLIVTEVSPSRVGRRVLNYIVDHIDTLIREWYPDLSISDGIGPRVRQYIPCVICERHNIKPHQFSFVECQLQSSKADTIPCPNHSGLDLNLHLVAPDVMLQDVDPDLLLSKEEIIFDKSESSLIGSGGFGTVVRGKCRNQQVAIKLFVQNDETDPLKHYFEARKELNVLRRVRQHPYLISIIGVCLRPLCLVLELAEKGNLQESLFSSMAIHRIVLCRIAYQVADALSYLHSLNIIYRDLKPENILVWSLDERDDLHVKLIDFGTANFATSTGLISYKGSLGIRAPEMLELSERKEEYTMQVDVYSYAILLFQIIVRKQPFQEFDSEPMVNAAVVRGERPQWSRCALSRYGLPSLTELMTQCWLSKPTQRPKSAQIAQQVRMPAFQALLGKQPIPSQQSVRHACVVPDVKELWIACDDHSSNKILIFDCNNLDLKHTFVIESFQEQKYALQIQALHHVADLMLIAVRGPVNFITAYSTTPRYSKVWCIPLNEQATCVTSDESYIYVGMNEGYVRCILKKDFKKSEKKRNDHMIKVERHCILSIVATNEKLWVSSSKYIFTYFTKTADMEAFDMESMWYGGSLGMEDKPQTRINNLTASFDHQNVWSTCRSVLTKWCAELRQRIFEIDCALIIGAIDHTTMLLESDACILCIVSILDTIWVGTAGGHILIFSADEPRLLTWFHPFGEVRTLSVCIGPGPCGTEQCLVISTGKNLRHDGLGTRNPVVCPLTAERVRHVPDELSSRIQVQETRSRSHRRSSSGSKQKAGHILEKEEVDAATQALMFKCSMLVWEAVPANVLARMEAKSGRVPIVAHYQRESSCEFSS